MKQFNQYALPLLLWAGVIFALSEQRTLPLSVPTGMDKLGHAGIYALLGWLAARCFLGYGSGSWAAFGLAVGAAAVYGASDELHQLLNPPRTADIRDWVADVLGGGAGGFLYSALSAFSSSTSSKGEPG